MLGDNLEQLDFCYWQMLIVRVFPNMDNIRKETVLETVEHILSMVMMGDEWIPENSQMFHCLCR